MIFLKFYFYPFKMLGGISYNPSKISFKETSNPLNNFIEKPIYPLNDFKEKTINKPEVNIKKIKSNKNTYTDADSLVEYFHGMLLNYINLKKSNNEVLDNETIQLKKVILDYNKESMVNNNLKINGGEIYKGEEYKEDDDIGVNIENNNDNRINIINIKYNKYKDTNNESIHDITIEYIKENTNISNKLIISLINGNIYETEHKVFKRVYSSSRIINKLIESIVNKLITLNIRDLKVYTNIDNKEILTDINNRSIIHQSVLSLIIIILSFRNNMDKDTYTKYNYTRFIRDMYINYLEPDRYKFSNNNANILLTYSRFIDEDISKYFLGDCALNALSCAKYKELHKLIVIKMNMIKNKEKYDYRDEFLYYDYYIYSILSRLDKNNINGYNEEIYNYMQEFYTFLRLINEYTTYTDYYKWIQFPDMNKIIITLLKRCIKFDSVIRSILIDYSATDKLSEYIINHKYIIETINELIKYFESDINEKDLEIKLNITNNIFSFYHNIIKNYNAYIFYINVLISLYLIYCKVDYLFDEKILKFYSHIDDRKYAINRFRNMAYNIHNIDPFKYTYYKMDRKYFRSTYNDNNEYFFSEITNYSHATLFIIEVNPNNLSKKYYVLDLNDLNFITFEVNDINPNDEYSISPTEKNYVFSFGPLRYRYYYYYLTMKKYNDECMYSGNYTSPCMDINTLEIKDKPYNYYATLEPFNTTMHECILKYIYRYFSIKDIWGSYDIPYRLGIRTINNKKDYESFKDFNINLNKYIKKIILEDLIYNNLTSINFNILINNDECIINNFIYYFIDLLYNEYFRINNNNLDLNTFYNNIISGYNIINIKILANYFLPKDNRFKLDVISIINDFNKNNYSKNIISGDKSLEYTNNEYNLLNNKFYGGELLENYKYNCNDVIKKIIIILLIIVIIIIIVLIVLYIINKYKNNSFK